MAIRHTTKADSSFSAQGKRVWEEDHTGDASDLLFAQSGTGASTRTVQDKIRDGEVSIKDFGAKCDGSTDDSTAWQLAVDAIGDTSVIQRSGVRLLIPGPTVIGTTITVRRKAIHIYGPGGWGSRNDTFAGRSYILWAGIAGIPMLKVQDVQGFKASGLRFIGKSTAKPSAAINYNETNDGWPIHACHLEDIWIGYDNSGETDAASQFTHGILLDGTGINNAEHFIQNVHVNAVDSDGLHVGAIQNTNIHLNSYYAASCAGAAIYNCAHIIGTNWVFSANAIDIKSPSTDDNGSGVVSYTECAGYFSETAARMFETGSAGSHRLTIHGGSFSLSNSLNADGKVIKGEGNNAQYIRLIDMKWVQASAPATSPYLAFGTNATGFRHIVVDGCLNHSLLTGGTNGMDVATTGVTGRAYVYFRDAPGTTGFYPPRVAQNFIQGTSSGQWDITQHETWHDTSLVLKDDFLGDTLRAEWDAKIGTDGSVATPAISVGTNGICRMTTGANASADMAGNGVQLQSSLNWDAAAGPLVFEVRIKLSAITSVAVFLGFTNQTASLQIPINGAGGGDTFTNNATNAVGVVFDTTMTTKNWWLVGVAASVGATGQNTAVAPVAGTYETWRVEISGNTILFYRNKVLVGSTMTNDIRTISVTPVIAAFSRSAASRNIDMDYVYVQARRI